MNIRFINRLLPLLLVVVLACKRTDPPLVSPGGRGALVASSESGTLSKAQIIAALDEPNLPAQTIAQYDVTYYKVTYQTDYDGKMINSSGLVILPKGVAAPRLLAYFHGTQLPISLLVNPKNNTPSLFDGRSGKDVFREVRTMGLSFATAGYAVFMPDYIGYGVTDGQDHPYINYAEMFKSNVDGLLAARELMKKQGIADDKRVFLTGWSQGGGAALSAHKYIQESYADRFTVVASSSLAGPFNVTKLVNTVMQKADEEQGITFVVSWALYALNKFSAIKRPTDQIWTFPVANQSDAITKLLGQKKPNEAFKGAFISGILNGTDKPFVDLLKSNSVHEGWKPVGKVILHHGNKDNIVPYFNSTDAEAGIKAQGGDVKLYTYDEGNHENRLGPYVANTLNEFAPLR